MKAGVWIRRPTMNWKWMIYALGEYFQFDPIKCVITILLHLSWMDGWPRNYIELTVFSNFLFIFILYLFYIYFLFFFLLLFLDQDTTLVFPFPFLFSIELTQKFPRWKLPQNFYQLINCRGNSNLLLIYCLSRYQYIVIGWWIRHPKINQSGDDREIWRKFSISRGNTKI